MGNVIRGFYLTFFCLSMLICKSQIDGYKELKIGKNILDETITANFVLRKDNDRSFLLKSKTPQYFCDEKIEAFGVEVNTDNTIKTIEAYTIAKIYKDRVEFIDGLATISQCLVDAFGKADYVDDGHDSEEGQMRFAWQFPKAKTIFLVYVNDPPTFSKNVKIGYRMVWDFYKPTESLEKNPKLEPIFSYGTGTLITDDLVITCYHVIKNGKQIDIRGINGRFDTTYSSKLDFFDADLDIAFLRILNSPIHKNLVLPYSINQKKSEVGEPIFVLGYPLQNTMGQEIKLTTGVISSNSGFLGDTSLFQISAPIQPGNSGGPLFDSHGNLIGIVSAKHNRADNVGYAVKLSLFQDLLKRKGINFSYNKNVSVELSKQVKLFKDYIYSIEVAFE